MNRYILLIFMLIPCLLLTGCWSYREINSLYIVAGIAVDKEKETEKYKVTTEFINIKENQRDQGFESVLLESKGDSILDAVSKMIRISAKKPYWGHASSIIISEEVARESIIPVLDLIARDEEPRLNTNIFISRESSAKEILEMESFSTDVRSYELGIMSNESQYLVHVPLLKTYEVINLLSSPKVDIVLPTILAFSNNGEDTNLLSGGAVFNRAKLVGFLEEDNILPYLFITNRVESGTLNIKVDEMNPGNTIVLEILGSNTKINPTYGTEKIGFDILVKTETTIAELNTMSDYISIDGRAELERLGEEYLEKQIKENIKDVQKKFGLDIFGFASIIRQRNYKLWEEIESEWDNIFLDIDLNIECDIHIINSGHLLKPIKVVD